MGLAGNGEQSARPADLGGLLLQCDAPRLGGVGGLRCRLLGHGSPLGLGLHAPPQPRCSDQERQAQAGQDADQHYLSPWVVVAR